MRDNQFQVTKTRFMESLSFIKSFPITYEFWMTLDDEFKAAALYLNFYPQIILAWQNETDYFLDEEDVLSIMMQYLVKNVDKIKDDRKRWSRGYIYTCMKNAVIGIRRIKKNRDFSDNTQSNIFMLEDGEHDLYDVIEDEKDCFRDARFWRIIENLDDDMKAYVSHLIYGTKFTAAEKRKLGDGIGRLKILFADFTRTAQRDDITTATTTDNTVIEKDGDNAVMKSKTTTFGDIYQIDDSIESAVCVMSDGEKAVYYGEKQILHDTKKINVVFFGSKRDYIVPLEIAKNLEVIDLDCY